MARRDRDILFSVAGFILIFGFSGLIYGLLGLVDKLAYSPFIIGSIFLIIGLILVVVIVSRRK